MEANSREKTTFEVVEENDVASYAMRANRFYHDVLLARDSLAESLKSGVSQKEVEAKLGVADSSAMLRANLETSERQSMMGFLERDSRVKGRKAMLFGKPNSVRIAR